MIRLFAIAFTLTTALSGGPFVYSQEATPATDSLLDAVDPARDDWPAEIFERRAAAQLSGLAELLQRGSWKPEEWTAHVLPAARATPLRPRKPERRELADGTRIESFRDTEAGVRSRWSLSRAVEELIDALPRTAPRRIDFKVVGVDLTAASSPSTVVRYEGAGGTGRPVQQTATWRITWSSGDAQEPPRIANARLLRYDEIRRPGFFFSDCTGGVLPRGAGWIEHVLRGGEYWHGRIDAAGGLNLMGHNGIAVGDVDGDDLPDLYVALGNGLPNKLLVQNPDGTVRDTAPEAGVAWLDDTKGAIFADLDNDGDQDLATAIGPTVVLGYNDGEGRFEAFSSLRASTPAPFYSLSAADFDLDGDLDIFGARYVQVRYAVSVPVPLHDANNGPSNHLLRNDGEGRFTDVTREVGLDANNARFSLIGAWADYDDDGDPDLYVANDFGRNNLYRNDGGHFVDVAVEAGVEDQAAGMGVSWADYDLDGDLDLHVTNMFSAAGKRVAFQPRFHGDADPASRSGIRRHALGDSLFANRGDGTFADVSDAAGIRMGRWGWGARFADWNNDGYDDIVVPNGFLTGALDDDL